MLCPSVRTERRHLPVNQPRTKIRQEHLRLLKCIRLRMLSSPESETFFFFFSNVPYCLHVGLQLPRRGHFPCFSRTSSAATGESVLRRRQPHWMKPVFPGRYRRASLLPWLDLRLPRRRLVTEASFRPRRVIDDVYTTITTARATTTNILVTKTKVFERYRRTHDVQPPRNL